MKTRFAFWSALFRLCVIIALAALNGSASAGLLFQMNVIHDSHIGQFTLAPNLYLTDDGGDSTPLTYDQIYSPHTNFTGGVGDGSLNDRTNYTSFSDFMNAVTNGTWKLILNVGTTNEHRYTFTVHSTLVSNQFADAAVDYPMDGATNVEPLPTYAWHGPVNSDTLQVYVYRYPDIFNPVQLTPATTNTLLPPALAPGDGYGFYINYETDVSTLIAATTALDGSNNPPANFSAKAVFDTGNEVGFSVVIPPIDTSNNFAGGYTNIAQYEFDFEANPYDPFNMGIDSSTNGYNLSYRYWGPIFTFSTNAEAGAGAVNFVGTSALEPFDAAYDAWTNTLSGNFSVSFWINTTNRVGNDYDDGDDGQYLVYTDGSVAIGLTGHKVGFFTTDTNGDYYALHSQQDVTTGQYFHIVATRDAGTGERAIYINGQLDSSDIDGASLMTTEAYAQAGGAVGFDGYTGLMDDLQFYTGVLPTSAISNLYLNPGAALSNFVGTPAGPTLGQALNATNLVWTTSGDALWFTETNVTFDGVLAAQPGTLPQDGLSSLLQTTVTGPGTLTFYWKVLAFDRTYVLEFDLDDEYYDEIYSNQDWTQVVVDIPAGAHTLTWNANTDYLAGSTTNDASWVDLVQFTPAPPPSPVSILNPKLVGTNFQFSFTSTAGHTDFVQYSTNLANTNWLPYTNLFGDGSLQTIVVTNNAKQIYFRIDTQ